MQFDYSILNRSAEKEILPYAAEQDLGCVVRGPLHKGMLSGNFSADTSFPAGDLRERWPAEPWYPAALEKVEKLRGIAAPTAPLSQVALQFVLAEPAVSVAIPGAKNASQVEQNVAASLHPPLGNDDLSAVKAAAPLE